jgi:signal transduction histidine kinase
MTMRPLPPAETTPDVAALNASRRHLAAAADALGALDAALRQAEAQRARGLAELEAAVRQQEAFLASIAYELRNPLTVIKGQAQLLQRQARRTGAVDFDGMLRGLERIDAGVTATTTLVEGQLAALRRQIAALRAAAEEPDPPDG